MTIKLESRPNIALHDDDVLQFYLCLSLYIVLAVCIVMIVTVSSIFVTFCDCFAAYESSNMSYLIPVITIDLVNYSFSDEEEEC